MWLLSASGDLFDGKRQWLRPGTQHLLGRTSGRSENGEHVRYINHKSVSRKHVLITVGEVQPGDVSKLHVRTSISLKDNSKVGTDVNGDRFTKTDKVLDGTDFTIKLGSWDQVLRLVWQPVTLTCLQLGKNREKSSALAPLKEQLAGTDVKLLADYVSNQTTHVIAKKRNVAQVLQGLVQGKWLLTYDWLSALATAAKREGNNADGDPKISLLEDDFDTNWPSEEEYFVPAGKEPVKRPDEYVRPNPERAELFQDFAFVFVEQSQYDSLMPVVTSGGGKCLLRELNHGDDQPEELVEFVKGVAGKKGDSHFRLSQMTGTGGVVVVRPEFASGDTWTRDYMRSVDVALDQRSMNQNEFLDLVLTLDTGGLRRPLTPSQAPPDPSQSQQQPPSPPQSPPQADEEMAEPEVQQQASEQVIGTSRQNDDEEAAEEQPAQPAAATKRKWKGRAVTKSRFQGFDDFDTSQFTKAKSPSPDQSVREPSQAPSVQAMDFDPSQPAQTQQTQQSSRKRAAATQLEEEQEDMYENLLQGQAALKRRKTEAVCNGEKTSFSKSFLETDRLATEKTATKKRKEKQIDVKAALAERRAAEEERYRKDQEALKEQLEGIDLGDIQPTVEEMEVSVRERPARQAGQDGQGARWDPAWSERKNFKKFRPQGQNRDGPRGQRVIVQLEETRNPGHGIGDEYWLTSNTTTNTTSGRSKSKSQQSQSQTQRASAASNDNNTQEATRFQRRLQRSREEDAEAASDPLMDADVIAGTARDEGLRALKAQSQTFGTESQRRARGKRAAPAGELQGGGVAKKARGLGMGMGMAGHGGGGAGNAVVEEEVDDGLKFRRRRR